MNSQWLLPLLLSLIILPWMLRLRRRKLYSGTATALLLVYLLLGSPLAVSLGELFLTEPLPTDSGQSAQAIVILGRGAELRPQRVETAVSLWRDSIAWQNNPEGQNKAEPFFPSSHRAPLIFVSGIGDAPAIAAMLEKRGIPASAIDGEPCSRTTEENAQFTAALLQPKGIRQILLVTDPPHMLRSWLTFRSLGFEVIPHTSPLPLQFPERKTAFLFVRESLGFVTYGLLGRYTPRSVTENPTAMRSISSTEASFPLAAQPIAETDAVFPVAIK